MGEAAGEHDQVAGRQRLLVMPDHRRRPARARLQRHHDVAVAVGAGEDHDHGLHRASAAGHGASSPLRRTEASAPTSPRPSPPPGAERESRLRPSASPLRPPEAKKERRAFAARSPIRNSAGARKHGRVQSASPLRLPGPSGPDGATAPRAEWRVGKRASRGYARGVRTRAPAVEGNEPVGRGTGGGGMAWKPFLGRDSARLSGIKWDKWDSVGRAAQAQGATAAPDAGPIAGSRLSTTQALAYPAPRLKRFSALCRSPWRDPDAASMPCAPDRGPESRIGSYSRWRPRSPSALPGRRPGRRDRAGARCAYARSVARPRARSARSSGASARRLREMNKLGVRGRWADDGE